MHGNHKRALHKNEELMDAVYDYCCSYKENSNTCLQLCAPDKVAEEIARRYGWPISKWWDMSNVQDLSNIFYCRETHSMMKICPGMFPMLQPWYTALFNQDLSSWHLSNVTDMRGMFNFNQKLSSWDVSNVTDMTDVFDNANSFNQVLSSWDVSNVTDMTSMFMNAQNFNHDVSSWITTNVFAMAGKFYKAGKFNQDILSSCGIHRM
jgi:surface protein